MNCQKPINLKAESIKGMYCVVPCGRCPNCIKRRVSGWSHRLRYEAKRSISSYFLTLTYDTDHVPITRNGFMSLSSEHLQLFFKRVRKAHERCADGLPPIRYYAVGEYGGRTKRPHYHILLFNAQLEVMYDKPDLLCLHHSDFDGKAHVLCKQWTLGVSSVGKVENAAIGYCLKYMSKERTGSMHRNDDRLPEFSRMSKGIGENYVTAKTIAWHKANRFERMYIPIEDGKKIAMPRYYKLKMYSQAELNAIGMHHKRVSEEKALFKAIHNDLMTLAQAESEYKGAVDRMRYRGQLSNNSI